jgi:CRISPR-associated protein Csm3
MSYTMQLITGKINVVTGLHIGSGDTEMHIGGTDNAVIKNGNEPYIPGSSLKGKMRSLLYVYTGSVENAENPTLAKLFGVAAGDKTNKTTELKTARLSFWDCFLNAEWKEHCQKRDVLYTETKIENTINRHTGTSSNIRSNERVIPGAVFDFKLTVKVYDDEDLLSVILGTMKLLETDSLGGSGSRGYGKIKFSNLQIDNRDIQTEFDNIQPFKQRFI